MQCDPFIAVALAACAVMAAERPAVAVYVEFPADVTSGIRNEFRKEIERALGGASVDLVWRLLDKTRAGETFDWLVVVRFQGDCQPIRMETRGASRPLGLTHVTDGRVQPFIELNCQRVLEAMDTVNGQGGLHQPQILVGRALGRVAAHEIHHALTGGAHHDCEGLMRRSFDRRDLCGSELSFSEESVRRLKISLGTETQAVVRSKPKTRSDE